MSPSVHEKQSKKTRLLNPGWQIGRLSMDGECWNHSTLILTKLMWKGDLSTLSALPLSLYTPFTPLRHFQTQLGFCKRDALFRYKANPKNITSTMFFWQIETPFFHHIFRLRLLHLMLMVMSLSSLCKICNISFIVETRKSTCSARITKALIIFATICSNVLLIWGKKISFTASPLRFVVVALSLEMLLLCNSGFLLSEWIPSPPLRTFLLDSTISVTIKSPCPNEF